VYVCTERDAGRCGYTERLKLTENTGHHTETHAWKVPSKPLFTNHTTIRRRIVWNIERVMKYWTSWQTDSTNNIIQYISFSCSKSWVQLYLPVPIIVLFVIVLFFYALSALMFVYTCLLYLQFRSALLACNWLPAVDNHCKTCIIIIIVIIKSLRPSVFVVFYLMFHILTLMP
jgi:hypothetical protein